MKCTNDFVHLCGLCNAFCYVGCGKLQWQVHCKYETTKQVKYAGMKWLVMELIASSYNNVPQNKVQKSHFISVQRIIQCLPEKVTRHLRSLWRLSQ